MTATIAPNARAAAEYFPANYWYSLLQVPAKSEFPGTGPKGNGISPEMSSQGEWVDMLKTDGCQGCHQIGDKASREIPKALGVFDSTVAAWERRLQSGQDGGTMVARIAAMGKERSLAGFANWTDRIAAGELPPSPPRPQGIERNLVVSMWDWATPQTYFHDEISSDKRNPTVNANGPIYGVHENGSDFMSVVDPVRNTATQVPIPVRDPRTPFSSPRQVTAPSPYWGEEVIWNSKANAHSGMMDKKGRLWLASVVRPPETPEYCRAGSDHPSAKLFPIERSNRQVSYYDPKTGQFTFVDTCFGTHHLMFAEDANDTLWFCGGGQVVGWLNTKMFDETGDAAKSQGWTALVLDTNGNGKRDAYVEPNQPLDPTKDKRLPQAFYSAIPSPADNSIWGPSTASPAPSSGSIPAPTRQRPRLRKSTRCRGTIRRRQSRDFLRGAAISIATASCGLRWRADISPASIAASARVRSMGRRRRASIAQRAGRFTSSQALISRAPRSRAARTRATTRGSTSSGRWAPATTCPSPPATAPARSLPWLTESSRSCASRIRSGSTPRGSTAASTTREPGGRARRCGPRTPRAR